MKRPEKETVITRLEKQLKRWLELPSEEIEFQEPPSKGQFPAPEIRVKLLGKVFRMIYLPEIDTSRIFSTVHRLSNQLEGKSKLPVIFVVPYMTKKGKAKCREVGLSWIDLSGNAHIKEPPLYIHVEGKENQFKKSGRPASVFAPEASKLPLTFLLNPNKAFTVKELANKTKVSSATASRVARRLESLGFITQNEQKGRAKPYKLKNPFTMLEAWVEDYDFSRHKVLKGAIAETSSTSFFASLKELLISLGESYSLSGPRVTKFYGVPGGSSLTVAYVSSLPSEDMLKKSKFIEGKRGSNVWLAEPKTSSVYMGSKEENDLSIVNLFQLYLDLKSIGAQRSEELAEEIYLKIKKELQNAGF